ncbi:hypothetical protein PQG43_12095 [Aquirufa sp. WAEICH-18A]|uniref:Uncharacterized protein n=1 Tax=Aquirufa aurantiipilula TaxID=2696561 RepID=A0ABT6BN17_9BACT|nr:hypothetical protein [Aquirufa aurantiipilula]
MEKNNNNKNPIENIKLNICLSKDVHDVLKTNASKDYIKVATYVKQILMKNLFRGDKDSIIHNQSNGRTM